MPEMFAAYADLLAADRDSVTMPPYHELAYERPSRAAVAASSQVPTLGLRSEHAPPKRRRVEAVQVTALATYRCEGGRTRSESGRARSTTPRSRAGTRKVRDAGRDHLRLRILAEVAIREVQGHGQLLRCSTRFPNRGGFWFIQIADDANERRRRVTHTRVVLARSPELRLVPPSG